VPGPPSASPQRRRSRAGLTANEVVDALRGAYRQARGTDLALDATLRIDLVGLPRRHGASTLLEAFRAFLAKAPPGKPIKFFVADIASWVPNRLRAPPREPVCPHCGEPIVGTFCQPCGTCPADGSGPEARAGREAVGGLVSGSWCGAW